MSVPSADFHSTTSRVVSLKVFHCSPTSLRYFGAKSFEDETKASAKWLGIAPTAANIRWSGVKEALDVKNVSGAVMRSTASVSGFNRKRWAEVFCSAPK